MSWGRMRVACAYRKRQELVEDNRQYVEVLIYAPMLPAFHGSLKQMPSSVLSKELLLGRRIVDKANVDEKGCGSVKPRTRAPYLTVTNKIIDAVCSP